MHKAFTKNTSDYILVACGVLFLILSMWKLSFTVYILPLIVFYILKQFKDGKINLNYNLLDLSLFGVVFLQLIILSFSSYIPNSLIYSISFIEFYIYYLFLRYCVLTSETREKIFLIGISTWFLLLGLFTLFGFLFFKFNIEYEGFTDIINFRNLYHPLGQLSNDWVGFLLFFLTITTLVLFKSVNRYLKIGSLIASFVLSYCLILSFSRGAYLSLVCFFMVTLFGILFYNKRKAVYVVAIISVTILLSLPFKNEAGNTLGMVKTNSQQRSISGRSVLWEGALDMFTDNPVKGVGQANFLIQRNKYLIKSPDSFYTGRVTNSFLQLLAEQGVLGLLAWGSVLFALIFSLLKALLCKQNGKQDKIISLIILAGLLAYGLREMTFSTFFQNPGLKLLFAILFAYSSAHSGQKENMVGKKGITLFLVITFFLSLWAAVSFLQTSHVKKLNDNFNDEFSLGNYQSANNSIEKAIRLQKKNALLHFNSSLIADTILNKYPIYNYNLSDEESDVIQSCIKDLERAEELSPYDAMIKHNMAVLYSSVSNNSKARIKLDEAIKLEPYEPLYLASKGMFLKINNNPKEANHLLLEAAKLSPEILKSQMWNGFTILNSLIDSLVISDYDTLNPILMARIAQIKMNNGDLSGAKQLFNKVITTLPNLNRPWLFLGQIALQEKDTSKFKTCLHRAMLLDGSDMLVHYTLGNFHASVGDTSDAIYYYRQCLTSYANCVSPNFIKTKGYYQTETIRNSLLPSKLLFSQKHDIDVKNICLILAGLYKSISKQKEAQLFKACFEGNKKLVYVLEETSIKRL